MRDDARGILCTIAEHDQHTELAYYRQVKRGCREHMYAILSRDMFRNLFNKSYFDPYVARHAMNSCLCAIETRPCPICGLAYQLCTCSQPFENISSSNDHSTSLQNSRLFGGSYQGNAVFGMYVDGVGHVLGRCLTENAIHFAQDDVTQSDIECWAVSDVVRKSQIYVTKLALPDAGVCTFVDRGAASAQVWGIGGLRGGDDVCAQGTVGERECIFECTEDRFEDEASRVPPVELSEDNSAVEGNGTRIACDLPLTGGLTEAVVGDGPVPQRIGDDANACDSIDEGGSRADETQTIDRASNPTPKRKGVQYLRRPALISGGCSWGEVKETVSRIWSTAPAILPRPADQEIRTPYVDRRQYMLQARKMRNRESAKRSNIRKKAAYRKLRDEIEHAETEKVRLKEKERGLQTENRMLKAALLQ